jgi:hypothetical protein
MIVASAYKEERRVPKERSEALTEVEVKPKVGG